MKNQFKNSVAFFAILMLFAFGQNININDIYGVSVNAPTTGQVLKYNGYGWTNGEPISAAGTLTYSGGVITNSTTGGQIAQNTDASGNVTVFHTLGTATFNADIQVTGANSYLARSTSKTSSTIVFNFTKIDSTGSPIPTPVVSSAVTADWTAQVIPEYLFADIYTGAKRIYSLKKMRAAYTSPLISVRKWGSNAYKSFYPDVTTGEIALTSVDSAGATLATWLGTSNGFVRVWYDQSTLAQNATQTDSTKQPRIATAGALITQGTKPALNFDGSNDAMTFTSLAGTSYSVAMVQKAAATGGTNLGGGTSNYFMEKQNSTTIRMRLGSSTTTSITVASSTAYTLFFMGKGASQAQTYRNGSSVSTVSTYNGLSTSFDYIGSWTGSSLFHNGTIQMIGLWDSDKTSDAANINAYLNNIYSVY